MAKIYNTLAEWENAVKVLKDLGIEIPKELAEQEEQLRRKAKIQEALTKQLEESKLKAPIFSKLEDCSKYKPYSDEFKKCVYDTVEHLLEETPEATQPGLLLGRIQCGKTNTFVNIMGYAFDKGIDVCIVFTKGTNALAKQTVERLKKEYKPIPQIDVKDIMVLKDRSLTADIINSKKMIIVCKKEDDNLKHLTNVFTQKQPLLKTKKVLVIDDEADFASINYQKRHGKWYSAVIAKQIQDFIRIPEYCRYLQVTATPYSLYLQPGEELNLENGKIEPFRPRFTTIVPTHGGYIGGQQYFVDPRNKPESMYTFLYHPVTEKCISVMKSKNKVYIKNIMTSENIKSFRYTLLSYMIATIIRKIQTDIENKTLPPDKQKDEKTSCLIHLDVAKNKMVWQEELIKEFFEGVKTQLNGSPFAEFEEMFENIYNDFKASNEAGNKEKLLNNLMFPSYEQVKEELRTALNNDRKVIQVVNSDQKVESLLNDDGQLELTSLMNVFIGGSILDRGITIDRMLCFFYGRNPKKFQQDTVLQHARMYGNRSKEDMSVTRLHTTPYIYEVMQKMNDLDDRLREQIEKGIIDGSDPSLVFLNYSGGEITPCAKSKIAISNTMIIKPGMRHTISGFQTGPKTQITKTINEIDSLITSQPGYAHNQVFEIGVDIVVDIIKKIRSTYVYDQEPERQWQNYGLDWNENDMISCIAWCTQNTNGKMLCLHHKDLNAARYRSDGKFTNAPETGSTDLRLAREKGKDMPVIILIKENGEEAQGWRGTPFYWPVFVAQQNVDKSIFTLDSDTKVKEYVAPKREILDGITSGEVLTLPLKKVYFEAIEAGEKRQEFRAIDENSAAKLLTKNAEDEYIINSDAVKNENDLNAGIHSYNNGVFPFVPRKYQYILFRTSRDAKADLMLVEINPEQPYSFGCVSPRKDQIQDVLVENGESTDFVDDNYKIWIICYNFRVLRIHKYGEAMQICPTEEFKEPESWNAEELFNQQSEEGNGWELQTIKQTRLENNVICMESTVMSGVVHVGDVMSEDLYSAHLLDNHSVDKIEIDGKEVDSASAGQVATFYFYNVSENNVAYSESDQEDDDSDIQQDESPLSLPIDDMYYTSGKIILIGTIESGTIHQDEEVSISNGMKLTVNAVLLGRDAVKWATKGERVCLAFNGFKIQDKKKFNLKENLKIEGINKSDN